MVIEFPEMGRGKGRAEERGRESAWVTRARGEQVQRRHWDAASLFRRKENGDTQGVQHRFPGEWWKQSFVVKGHTLNVCSWEVALLFLLYCILNSLQRDKFFEEQLRTYELAAVIPQIIQYFVQKRSHFSEIHVNESFPYFQIAVFAAYLISKNLTDTIIEIELIFHLCGKQISMIYNVVHGVKN